MNIVLTATLLANVLILAAILFGYLQIFRLFQQFRTFIAPQSEGKASPLANVTQVAADMIGRGISASLKTTFMGKQSAAVRGENAVKADIVTDTISMANPAIGAVLESFPSLKKTLTRNPALLDFALSRVIPGKAPAETAASPNNGAMKFEL